jgi:hypothetical protein
LIKSHLCRLRLWYSIPFAGHAGAGCAPQSGDQHQDLLEHLPRRRDLGQLAGEPSKHRLPQQASQQVANVLAGGCTGRRVRQTHRVIEVTVRHNPATVEIEP